MEAVARQFANDRDCVVLRNGWFSFRWSQIFDAGDIPASCTVLKARLTDDSATPSYAPAPVEAVVAAIRKARPSLVCSPHVETSSGIILSEEYMRAVSDAVRGLGIICVGLYRVRHGLGRYGSRRCRYSYQCAAERDGARRRALPVMMNDRARKAIDETTSNSFACDLKVAFDYGNL